MKNRSETVIALWQRIWDCLEAEKRRIQAEIRNYPHPIPACDQHFNSLLESRDKVLVEMDRAKAAQNERLAECDPVRLLSAFLDTATCLDAATAWQIRTMLPEGPNGLET
jgi:hypothetical protein